MATNKIKKALIFDPYLDTLGGGERYALTFALSLLSQGFEVDLAWKNKSDLEEAELRFGLDLSWLNLSSRGYDICSHRSSIWDRLQFTKQYDLIFWVSDGSLPFLFARNNLVHFQVPFTRLSGNPLINMIKLAFINKLVYNSQFTRKIIERSFPSNKGVVLYPPIDTQKFISGKKENIILSVARFTSPSHSKRQDVLIDAFKELSSRVKGYRLILTGGHKGDDQVINDLKKRATGLQVEIIPNLSFDELRTIYSKSKFFWHAAGFEIDEEKEPEKVEHFGMTTVEAMSAGCIPVVIAKGGQKEIISEETGKLFNTVSELVDLTEKFINDPEQVEAYSKAAIQRSQLYSTTAFNQKVSSLLHPK